MHLCSSDQLRAYVRQVALAVGAADDIADELATHLIKANLSGHDSHGVLRLPQYVAQADAGGLVPNARPTVVREMGGTTVMDAHFGFGQYSTAVALDWAMERARTHGIAAVASRHATHIGRLGEYTERASAAGMIAIVTIGTAAPGGGGVAPFGGAQRFLGTNPWSFGVPADGPTSMNMVYDAATSVVAEGKLRVARSKNAPLAPGLIVDKDGNPSTNAEDFYNGGALLPVGGAVAGHKGYGLSMASALIAGLAMVDDDRPVMPVPSAHPDAGFARGALGGVFVIAMDPAAFGDSAEYRRLTGETLAAVKATPPAPGTDEVLVPGEPEIRSRAAREREGIPIPAPIWQNLAAVATRFGIAMPEATTM
ncbi:MAG: Ldh family oxidoreductase [Thermomicrobia bacterium]|nr:Ldh family oxidoreductase [Thermomicrobia bacterium]MCA1725500.1 Ldh family oxidoreductase [Thermomicrobia bacterium]